MVEKARALFVRNGLVPACRRGRLAASTESNLADGPTYRADPSTSPFESKHRFAALLGIRRARRCDVSGGEVSKPRTPVATVTRGARGRFEEGSLFDGVAIAPFVVRSFTRPPRPMLPSFTPVVRAPSLARARRIRSGGSVRTRATGSRAFAPKPRTALVGSARRVARRTDERTPDGMAPRDADGIAPRPQGGGQARKTTGNRPMRAGGQGRRPRAGEDQRLADVPARPSSLQKLSLGSWPLRSAILATPFGVPELRGRRLARRVRIACKCSRRGE
jgi:hypothetical protein